MFFFRFTRTVLTETTVEMGCLFWALPLLLGVLWLVGAVVPMMITAVSMLLQIIVATAFVLAIVATAAVSVGAVVMLKHYIASGKAQVAWDRAHHPERFIVQDMENRRRALLAARFAPSQFEVGTAGQIEAKRVEGA